jgi:hypothetical protein
MSLHITKTEAQALATFISRVRTDWDHPGVMAAIHKARDLGSAAAIGAALCRLAENTQLRTPALLAEPGAHWAGTTVATRQPPQRCTDHPTQPAGRCTQCEHLATPPPPQWRTQ